MIRKLYAVLSLAVLGLVMAPAIAAADTPPYAAPSVSPATLEATVIAAVTPAPQQATVSNAPLASTGAGLNVGLWLTIGAVVLLLGITLTIVGTRLVTSRGSHH